MQSVEGLLRRCLLILNDRFRRHLFDPLQCLLFSFCFRFSVFFGIFFHVALAFYGYAMWTETGVFSFGLGTIGSGFFCAVALWCILFASSDGRISRKTGADKRTSVVCALRESIEACKSPEVRLHCLACTHISRCTSSPCDLG